LWYNARLRATIRQRAEAQVEELLTAKADAFPMILRGLASSREDVLPLLRRRWQDPELPADQRLRVGLALLPVDDAPVELLRQGMLDVDPSEMLLIRDALQSRHAESLTAEFWKVVDDPKTTPERRFRALVVLAGFDPASKRWGKAAQEMIGPFLEANPPRLGLWTEALRPMRLRLLAPLGQAFRDPKTPAELRQRAALILADYAADQPKELVDLALDANPRQYLALWPHLQQQREQALTWLLEELSVTLPREGKDVREADRERLARRQAQAAVSLYRFGIHDPVWQRLRFSRDPRLRTWLVHRLGPLQADPGPLVAQLKKEEDVSARRALILSLGEFPAEKLPEEVRLPLTSLLVRWYRQDPDPGVHAAIGWLLGHGKEGPMDRKLDWQQGKVLRTIDQQMRGQAPAEPQRWYVNGQGQTMVILPPGAEPLAFTMGSPAEEHPGETEHRRVIPRAFAVASTKVTFAEFQRFLKDHPEVNHHFRGRKFDDDPNLPILSVTWYEAIQYCRWLSEQEGIPEDQMCYPSVAEIEKSKQPRAEPLRLPGDYLKRTGYRLPSEAEWEYACRADTTTSRFCGCSNSALVLPYAWCKFNADDRPWPVGQKKPNDFGLFDTYGNAFEWCQEEYRDYPTTAGGQVEDREDKEPIFKETNRVRRGGGFARPPGTLRSAARYYDKPLDRDPSTGFRVVRTQRREP
jgi:formylglycine-generating enzyme required for sulfatase activity